MQPAVLFARHAVGLHGLLPAFAQAGACCISRDSVQQWLCCSFEAAETSSRHESRQESSSYHLFAGSRALSTASKSAVRVEKDTMGSLEVPADRWGPAALGPCSVHQHSSSGCSMSCAAAIGVLLCICRHCSHALHSCDCLRRFGLMGCRH